MAYRQLWGSGESKQPSWKTECGHLGRLAVTAREVGCSLLIWDRRGLGEPSSGVSLALHLHATANADDPLARQGLSWE